MVVELPILPVILKDKAAIVRFKRGKALWGVGEEPPIYVICSGVVRVDRPLPKNEHVHTVDLLGPGEILGDAEMVLCRDSNVNVVALGPVKAHRITRPIMRELMSAREDIRAAVMRSIAVKEMRRTELAAQVLAYGDVESRLARLVLYVGERFRLPSDARGYYNGTFGLNRIEVAQMVGTRSETVTRILARWQQEGHCIFNSKSILVTRAGIAFLTAVADTYPPLPARRY